MPTRRSLLKSLIALSVVLHAAPGSAGEAAEKAAADLLHRRLKNEAPGDAALLGAVKDRDVVVVAGSMDHIEQVLSAARIPYTMIQPEQVADYPFTSKMIAMVNCPGTMPMAGVRRLERFVRAGGLLYTTDWTLRNVVQKAFPGTIAHNGRSTGDEVVPVRVDRKDDNLMSRVLLRRGSEPQWWLEGGSHPIRILDRKRVEVLAHSVEMEKRYGASPVVVRFRWEDGEVIHVVSHFYRQLETRGPAVATKEAVINFEGLSDADKQEVAQGEWAGVKAGDVESSYAFQRMTTNLVTTKQKRNVELERMYNLTAPAPPPLRAAPSEKAPVVAPATPGARYKVLERRDRQVRVRDDRGNEGWTDEAKLIAQ